MSVAEAHELLNQAARTGGTSRLTLLASAREVLALLPCNDPEVQGAIARRATLVLRVTRAGPPRA